MKPMALAEIQGEGWTKDGVTVRCSLMSDGSMVLLVRVPVEADVSTALASDVGRFITKGLEARGASDLKKH